ncbi:hypothetical protein FOFC_07967 [Fusarium oxysporum]|nr:hypothetical protein FOFC_07558 [Fusarium oxysporum]KAI8411373.1 hypothetical protein FOFC_07967 [Fusarium oxysporum]
MKIRWWSSSASWARPLMLVSTMFLCLLNTTNNMAARTTFQSDWFWWRKMRNGFNLLKQKRVDCVVVSSKLHVFERSTAPYIISTSQPSVGRITLATLSQHNRISWVP